MSINDIFLKLYFDLNKPKQQAGFFLRVIAFIIDFVIISILNVFIVTIFNIEYTVESELWNPIYFFSHPYYIIINWLYFAILESNPNYQATIGKSILKLKVVDIDGNKISFGKSSGRFFAKFISGLILGIGFFMIAFTKNKQGLHDLVAGTFVKIKYS
jgi:uncharacterized RDD family membrane protein YckC